ncbi:MAG TPA: cation:proton antiporter [Gaiellaceae bacterium]|nr:cation:proton antiporter [Gaiellaceae bacterium]
MPTDDALVLGATQGTAELFEDIAVILLVSAIAGLVAIRLRQPLVVAFIAVGVVVGPSALGVVGPGDELELFAELGIAILLFVVGLKLDLHVVRRLGPVAVAVGFVQVALIAAGGLLLALVLGFDTVSAAYIGVGLAFSSTVIVVKLLSDRRELETLHGRLSVGILIVQDIVVVVALIVVATTGERTGSLAAEVLSVVGRSTALLLVVAALMRWVLEPLLHAVARSSELLVLFAIAWATSLAALGEIAGIGTEVGAFLAGFALASTPYREAIGSRLVSVRDFLLLFFFIDLGSRLDLAEARHELLAAFFLAAFVLVVKPLVIAALLTTMRYRSRVALETGVTLGQISEFSLILAALGLSVGQIGDEVVTVLAVVALVTIAATSYVSAGSETIARRLAPALARLERPGPIRDVPDEGPRPEVVVLGLGRFGHRVVGGLMDRGVDVLAVDFDPVAVSRWHGEGVRVVYGDVEDPELPTMLPLPESGWIVSTVRHTDTNLALLHAVRHHGYRGKVAVAAHHDADVGRLEEAGANRVLLPYASAAAEVVELVAPSD